MLSNAIKHIFELQTLTLLRIKHRTLSPKSLYFPLFTLPIPICFKASISTTNLNASRIKHRTLSPISSSFYIPNTQHPISRQAHPLLRKSCGQPSSIPRFLSHPLLRRGLGRLLFCQFLSFLLFNLRLFAL